MLDSGATLMRECWSHLHCRMASSTPYFAYGSNLDAGDWAQHCGSRGVDPAGLRDLEPAWLIDHRLEFDYESPSREGGAADVVPGKLGQAVPGALMELDQRGIEAMDRKEGHPTIYKRRLISVSTLDGTTHKVETYCVTSGLRSAEFVAPTDKYVGLLRGGLEQRGLPTTHLDAAMRGLNSSGHSIGHIFVYGTLLPGECRNAHLLGYDPSEDRVAEATADLVHLGGFPGLIPGSGTVRGVLYTFSDPAPALVSLDQIEGFSPGQPSLFRRVVLQVQTKEGQEWAWAYVYDGAGGVPLPGGDWLEVAR